MPNKEQVTKQSVVNALELQVIGSNTTTEGAIIDTADYDMGVFFALLCGLFTDGVYTLKIEEGNDSGLSDASVVSSGSLVYGTLPALSAATVEGAFMSKEAVISTKRYLRASLVSTDVTTGATLGILAIMGAEVCATPQAG